MKPSLSGFLQGQGQSLHKAGPALYRQPCAGPDFVMQDMMQSCPCPLFRVSQDSPSFWSFVPF